MPRSASPASRLYHLHIVIWSGARLRATGLGRGAPCRAYGGFVLVAEIGALDRCSRLGRYREAWSSHAQGRTGTSAPRLPTTPVSGEERDALRGGRHRLRGAHG